MRSEQLNFQNIQPYYFRRGKTSVSGIRYLYICIPYYILIMVIGELYKNPKSCSGMIFKGGGQNGLQAGDETALYFM